MSRRTSIDLSLIVGAVTLAAAVGVAFIIGLTALATPKGFKVHVADLKSRADDIEARLSSRGQPFAYPANALCVGPPPGGALALRDRLGAAASGTAVSLTNVAAAAGAPDDTNEDLTPVKLTFNAMGSYQGVLSLLDRLSTSTPEIFVDSADLKSTTSAVSLSFQGRIYCLPSAHL